MSDEPTSSFPGDGAALVQGASRGIGSGFVQALLDGGRFERVIATCRNPDAADALNAIDDPRLSVIALDVADEASIRAAAERVRALDLPLRLLLNVAGVLHDSVASPEKKLEDLDAEALHHVFAVNAIGPALMLKVFRPLLARRGRVVVAALSARVGSIGDNRLGGWYAYRASKAALNQLLRTAAIELGRRNRNAIVVALHPGTTDTGLSKPFQARVPDEQLFPVDRTCRQLLAVIDRLDEGDSGGFRAWDGSRIDW
ncbi:SDR family oxidoreductase [Wenzhouxiangella sp. XN79A]|uniref:SDR family oxidoreductase n=1 Tax=Wenzhouxiangella sp. XN79A TaxID=2724193 RepID=UPI00144ACDC1|nr:SDR family oxidoreductase [Wenzhouxiangella sp. XN79A]NKI34957.1 SDR family oxidoreductase [Wenzhouxiangella sp. XN79A]